MSLAIKKNLNLKFITNDWFNLENSIFASNLKQVYKIFSHKI